MSQTHPTEHEIFAATCRANPHVDPDIIREALIERPERDRRYKEFMAAYRKQHAACPRCGSVRGIVTLSGYCFNSDKPEEYRDLNDFSCDQCGNTHTVHERAPNMVPTSPPNP